MCRRVSPSWRQKMKQMNWDEEVRKLAGSPIKRGKLDEDVARG